MSNKKTPGPVRIEKSGAEAPLDFEDPEFIRDIMIVSDCDEETAKELLKRLVQMVRTINPDDS